MGILGKLFGGGTAIEMRPDSVRLSPGRQIRGTLVLTGGKKGHKVSAVHVRITHTVVKKNEEGLPDVSGSWIVDDVVAKDVKLDAGATEELSFEVTIPVDTRFTDEENQYQLVATADIPKVVDPTARQNLTIVTPDEAEKVPLSRGDILARYPGLASTARDALLEGLGDFYSACHSDRTFLLEGEPILRSLIPHEDDEVQREAIDTWAHLLDEQVAPEHVAYLDELSLEPVRNEWTQSTIVRAAVRFADEGGLSIVERFAKSNDKKVRDSVASHYGISTDDTSPEKREVLLGLAKDSDEVVRASAYSSLSDYRKDRETMDFLLQQLEQDPSPVAKAGCIGGLALTYREGDYALSAYERHTTSPHWEVKKKIIENLGWQPDEMSQRVRSIVTTLVTDTDSRVRDLVGFYAYNWYDHDWVAEVVSPLAESDPDEQVRNSARRGLEGWIENRKDR